MITSRLSSSLNSKVILGEEGAELLYGDYDYLMKKGNNVIRIHGAKAR